MPLTSVKRREYLKLILSFILFSYEKLGENTLNYIYMNKTEKLKSR